MFTTHRLMDKLPPFLDGYEAICQAIAQEDIDHAWYLARQFEKTSRPLKREVRAVQKRIERQKGKKWLTT